MEITELIITDEILKVESGITRVTKTIIRGLVELATAVSLCTGPFSALVTLLLFINPST